MKKLCPALDFFIDIKECEVCGTIDDCEGKTCLSESEMIINIFAKMYPSMTFVSIEQAYNKILEGIDSK